MHSRLKMPKTLRLTCDLWGLGLQRGSAGRDVARSGTHTWANRPESPGRARDDVHRMCILHLFSPLYDPHSHSLPVARSSVSCTLAHQPLKISLSDEPRLSQASWSAFCRFGPARHLHHCRSSSGLGMRCVMDRESSIIQHRIGQKHNVTSGWQLTESRDIHVETYGVYSLHRPVHRGV